MVRQACSRWESDMAGEVPKDRRPVVEALERMWAQALTAVSSVEDEAARVVQKAQTLAGWSQDEVRRQVNELAQKLRMQRRELEQGVESGVRGALQRLRVPRREEVAALKAQVDRMAARVERLEQGSA